MEAFSTAGSPVKTYQFNMRHHEFNYSVRGISDQTIPAQTKGVLNPEVFEGLLKHCRFFACSIDPKLMVNTHSLDYVRAQMEKNQEPNDEVLIRAQGALDSINGRIFALPAGRFTWREKAPCLLNSVAYHGNIRPLCSVALLSDDGEFRYFVHPGKKRLSILRFLGYREVKVLVQVDKRSDLNLPNAEEIHSLSQLCRFWNTENIYFRASQDCEVMGNFRLEVQCYDEAHRRVLESLTTWEDVLDASFIQKRFESLAQGLTIYARDSQFEEIRQCVMQSFGFHDSLFAFEKAQFNLKLAFKKWDGRPIQDRGISLCLDAPVNFCVSHLLLFMYTPHRWLKIKSGEQTVHLALNDDASLTLPSDVLGENYSDDLNLDPNTFASWSIGLDPRANAPQ